MPRLVFPDGFDEEERSPIGQTADYAAVGEDESTGCACNAGKEVGSVGKERQLGKGLGLGKVLFDFVGGVRSAHADLIRSALLSWKVEGTRTMAIISYNMALSSYPHRS